MLLAALSSIVGQGAGGNFSTALVGWTGPLSIRLGQIIDPVTSIDLRGNGLEEDGGVSGMLAAVCTSLSREGSGLRVLRLGRNGAWGQEAAAALAGALASPSCVVEELDLSMCGAD